MALAREVWLNIVEDNLFTPALQQVQQAIKDDSAFVYSGGGVTTVHIPNAGTKATVTKGNDTYPVAVTKRTDSDNSYSLTNYEKGPILVQIKDGKLNSYEQTRIHPYVIRQGDLVSVLPRNYDRTVSLHIRSIQGNHRKPMHPHTHPAEPETVNHSLGPT